LAEADLQDVGIDLGDPDLLSRRTWPWLRTRLQGLVLGDTRLARVLIRPVPPKVSA
jgi:hypothetical protein